MLHKTQIPQHDIVMLRYGESNGIIRIRHKKHLIGYVLQGTLIVYTDTTTTRFSKGDIYFIKAGLHHVEHISCEGRPYEEIIVQLSNELLGTIIKDMGVAFGVDTSPHTPHSQKNILGEPASHPIRTYFKGILNYITLKMFDTCGAIVRMKTCELIYLILSNPNSPLRNQLTLMANKRHLHFEQIVRNNLFGDISIKHLSAECGMSLSGFKAEFQRHFHDSPHHWIITQRLECARALLAHTSDQVKSIARDCGFATASHFIKHFHNTYGVTPSQFRRNLTSGGDQEAIPQPTPSIPLKTTE